MRLYAAGIYNGMEFKNGSFDGSTAETRGNTVLMMYNAYIAVGGNADNVGDGVFTDVGETSSVYQACRWAAATGVVSGYGDGRFGPDDGITREQFCAILVRHAELAGIALPKANEAKRFSDADKISAWAANAVELCQRAGIVSGYEDGSFAPKRGISRAEMSSMICRYLNLI